MPGIKNYLKESRNYEVDLTLSSLIEELKEEGYTVEFGKIGIHTTYAMIYTPDHATEIVGYTFLQDMKYYKENVGQLKALQQAIARKQMTESRNK